MVSGEVQAVKALKLEVTVATILGSRAYSTFVK